MSELKPCPFCGSPAYSYHDNCIDFAGVKCDLGGCVCADILITENNWNTRPIEDALRARIAELEAELKITDELLKEATETIGAVVACCTYNSNDDAKIGIYGIDQKAFTRIDQFITHYNDAVSAGKVSVDVKTSTDNNKGE